MVYIKTNHYKWTDNEFKYVRLKLKQARLRNKIKTAEKSMANTYLLICL